MFDTLTKSWKKRVKVQNVSQNLPIDLCLDEDVEDSSLRKGDEEVKLEPKETIAERIKSIPRKRKKTGKGLKILTPNKLLTRIPILLYRNDAIFYRTKNKKIC